MIEFGLRCALGYLSASLSQLQLDFCCSQGLCVMTHAAPPIKVCPNGVLRDGMCLLLSLPDATTCPGGFLEQMVDGKKFCVATRIARIRIACYGPHEKLIEGECVEVKTKKIHSRHLQASSKRLGFEI